MSIGTDMTGLLNRDGVLPHRAGQLARFARAMTDHALQEDARNHKRIVIYLATLLRHGAPPSTPG